MRRLIACSTMLTVTAAGLAAAAPSGAAESARTPATQRPTAFGLRSSGYGHRVQGGQLPANSNDTAWDVIGCTNRAGIDHGNQQLGVTELVDGLRASAVRTRVRTTEKGGVVSSRARNTIAHVTLADTSAGTVSIDGLVATARAYHDGSGFHATTRADASITYTPPVGDPQTFDLPAPGQTLPIPAELATITGGTAAKRVGRGFARAVSETLTIKVGGSQSVVHLGHAFARIDGGIKSGIFGGFASGTRGHGADGRVTSGRTPLSRMPCQGTGGEALKKSEGSVQLGDQVVASGVNTQQLAAASMRRARGYERASVAKLNIGHGRIVVRGIVGRVHVIRRGAALNQLKANTRGTTIGSITVDGEPRELPDTGALRIPGVAKLESGIRKRVKGGMSVTALRVTLLDGSGTVLDLAQARFTIRKSHR